MSEILLQWITWIKLVVISLFALFYGLGGMDGKWKRRFVAPAIYILALIVFSLVQKTFSFYYLICLPLMIGGLCLGYGAENTGMKIFKRILCGVAISLAFLPVAIINHSWVLYPLHCILSTSFPVLLGVLNPVQAREEESLIATSYVLLPIFMI